MMRRIKAWLTGGRCVVLRDHNKQSYYTIAYRDAWGDLTANVYWFTKVGHVRLLASGETVGESSYIREWKDG